MNRYYYLCRPPSIGTQPDGFTARSYEAFEWNGRWVHGWVEYPEPLPFERAWRYDLVPADERERILYLLWEEADRDEERADRLLAECRSLGYDGLVEATELGGHLDYLAELVLRLVRLERGGGRDNALTKTKEA